ncbi:MAG: polysaccharide biosynthesis C-terminal domain-containing protein, partial [Deltaproteobacteria bacterium]|nr:polysaccharide biosynthesis C-terminal domain-containing protein [Deltaproteobacteria bacterium]
MIKEKPKQTLAVAFFTHSLSLLGRVGYNILIFREFSLEEVGIYGFIVSLAIFAGFALDIGLTPTLIRGFSQKSLSFVQGLVGSLAFRIPMLLLILCGWVVTSRFSGRASLDWATSLPLLLAILAQFLIALRTVPTSWLRARDRQNTANFLDVLQPAGYLAIGLMLLRFRALDLLHWFIGIVLMEAAVTVLTFSVINLWRFLPSLREMFSKAHLLESMAALWKPSLIFTLIAFWALIQGRLDWIMLYSLGSKTELALYSLANRVFEIFDDGFSVIIATTFPWVCKLLAGREGNPKFVLGFKGLAFSAVILAVLAALTMPWLLTLIWGDKFAQADHLIFLIMCVACLGPFNTIMNYLLIASGKEKYLLVATTVPALIQIAANLILIPHLGALGATINMVLLLLTSFILLVFFSARFKLAKFIGFPQIVLFYGIFLTSLLVFRYWFAQHLLNITVFISAFTIFGFFFLFSRE